MFQGSQGDMDPFQRRGIPKSILKMLLRFGGGSLGTFGLGGTLVVCGGSKRTTSVYRGVGRLGVVQVVV